MNAPQPPVTPPGWELIRQLAAFCAQAYASPNIVDPLTGAAALVLPWQGNVLVAFRGSQSPQDFIRDAEGWLTEYRVGGVVCGVHHGFAEDWRGVQSKVVFAVKNVLHTLPATARVYITGHSLGGALAKLGALGLAAAGVPVELILTFGQPRVGDALFKAAYNAALGGRTFRVVNQNDVVPRLPGWLLRYRHCGHELFLPPNGGWALDVALFWKVVEDALGLWQAYARKEDVLITEHFIKAYQQRLLGL